MANVIDYVEFAVDDLEEAKAFYEKALGWALNDYGHDYARSKHPDNPGQEFGGLSPNSPASRGEGVLALVRTQNADSAPASGPAAGSWVQTQNAAAALAIVLAAGGRVQVEMHDYPGGRRFTFADPSGNVLGVYEP